MTFEIGSTAYIVESNRIIREVTIVKRNGDFYIIRFGTRGGIKWSNRLFASYEDADSSIHKKIEKGDIVLHMTTYTKVNGRGIIFANMIDNPLQILYIL